MQQNSPTGAQDVTPILAIDPSQTRNGQRVADLARLGYLPEPVLDPTYGLGGMWTEYRPKVLIASDLDPTRGVAVADYRCLPWPGETFGSVLFDPPYRLAGTATNQGGMDDRYGIGAYRSVEDVHGDMVTGMAECFRVTKRDGYVIVKCAAQVCGGRVRWQPEMMATAARDLFRARLVDELHLIGGRAQPAGRSQQHARRNFSTFVVLARP